jgi:cell division septal protein FtsQ
MREGLWDRRLGGRGEQRSPLTRFGTAASPRITRPQSPIAERGRTGPLPERRGPYSVLLVLAASFAAGLGGGSSVAEATASWLAGEAPRLEAIAVRGAGQLSSAEIAAATGVPRGVDLRLVDAPAVAERLSRHPWIASARAVELPEGRLLVDVVERRAVATVSAPGSASVFAVDANGTPFAPVGDGKAPKAPRSEPQASEGGPPQNPAAGLPRLVQSAPVSLGEADPALAEAVDFARRLAALGLPRPFEIGVSAPDDPIGYWLRLEGYPPQVILGRDDLDARLGALARVLEVAPPDAAGAATLDLRFADQVVLRGTPSGKPEAIATGPGTAASGSAASGGRRDPKPGG